MNTKSNKLPLWSKMAMGGTALAIIVFVYVFFCLHTSREQAQKSMAYIEACSRYDFMQDGKLLFSIDHDTTRLGATFVRAHALWPKDQGLLLGIYNSNLPKDTYRGANLQQLFKDRIDSIDSLCTDSEKKVEELNYYIHSHNVKDMGFSAICRYYEQEKKLMDSSHKLRDSLQHLKLNKHLRLVKSIQYIAHYTSNHGKRISMRCNLVKWVTPQATCLFQLTNHQTPTNKYSLPQYQAQSLALLNNLPIHPHVDYNLHIDSLGWYRGKQDSVGRAMGYGIRQDNNGTYYEGEWKDGKRNGFGFSVSAHKTVRVGEWKADRFKGERMIYTADRIYGIDLSKHQHIKGTKRYGINWSALRISHLGHISKKSVSGQVDFPISFIYIKSTEGSTLLNPYYRNDYLQARSHGFKVGTYHFFSIISPASQQARQFLQHSIIRKGDLPPVLDLEPTTDQIKKIGGVHVLFARVRIWLRLIERETGARPILYVNQVFVNRYLSLASDIKRNYQIWIARYGEYKPDIHLAIWQLSPDGRVRGVNGEVDINVFNGYKEAYQKFLKNETVK